ncbi:hypothetical protein [Actinokineospora sp. HUAS TT18]|uniref:hypothetical protein n=1 Tax=Actinokineospora sp. HUAS TT18 TaxID=3447451 RepID=UPI003F526A83
MPDFPSGDFSLNMSPEQHATLLQATKPRTLDVFIATKYQGTKQSLPIDKRDYSSADLKGGVGINTISSLQFASVKSPGNIYSVTLYAEDGCRGDEATFYESTEDLGAFKNRTCSIRIELWRE